MALYCDYCSKIATRTLYCYKCARISKQAEIMSARNTCDAHLGPAQHSLLKEQNRTHRNEREKYGTNTSRG